MTALRKTVLPLLALALLLLATKLLVIAAFATPTPYMDQWTLAFALFTPLLNGNLTWHELLSTHVQHHIVTTRLLDIGLLLLNHGVWNPQLEMVVNALLHVAALLMLLLMLRRCGTPAEWPPLLLAATLLLVIPCGYINTIISFQSQVYFVLLFSFAALWCLSRSQPLAPAWWLGLLCGGLAALSFATGAVTLAVATLLSLLPLRDGAWHTRRQLFASLLLGGATLAAVAATPLKPYWIMVAADANGNRPAIHMANASAASLGDLLASLYGTLSWPTLVLAPLVQWPLLRFLWRQLRQPPPRRQASWFVFGLGLWSLGVTLLIAWGRSIDPVLSRYTDFFVVGLLLNFFCLLPGVQALPGPAARQRRLAFAWLAVVVTGLLIWTAGQRPLLLDAHEPQMASSAASIRAYLETGDFTWLTPRRFPDLPAQPRPAEMQAILDIPAVRSVLPPNLEPANAWRQAGWVTALLTNLRPLAWLLLTLCAACLPGLLRTATRDSAR